MWANEETTDVRPHLQRYVGEEVAVEVNTGMLRVVGRGVVSLIDGNVKALRVGDTTLTLDTWQAYDVASTDHAPEPWTTSFRMGRGAWVTIGWYDLLISDYEE